jgi:hypothetical protein
MSRLLEHHENCTLQDPMIRRETALAMRRAPRMSPRVYFTPWIGPHYGWKNTALSAARLLVLGASHTSGARRAPSSERNATVP